MATDHRMGPLKKCDLKYYYSDLDSPDDQMQNDELDTSKLNRRVWYQMLYFINKFANINGKGSAGVAKHAEKLIQEYLPADLQSHTKIEQWLLDNWKFHS